MFAAIFQQRVLFEHEVGTEELGHLEMVGTLVTQLCKDAAPKDWLNLESWQYYADNGNSVAIQSAQGSPFNAAGVGITGDALTNLYEDLAADGAQTQKQKSHYKKPLQRRKKSGANATECVAFAPPTAAAH